MDDLHFRRLKALRQATDHPFFGQAIDDLKRELADQIADEMDPIKAAALRAERFALQRMRDRIESYLNDLMMVERKTEQKKTHG